MKSKSRSPSRASVHSRADSRVSESGLSNLSFLSSNRGDKPVGRHRFFSPKAHYDGNGDDEKDVGSG